MKNEVRRSTLWRSSVIGVIGIVQLSACAVSRDGKEIDKHQTSVKEMRMNIEEEQMKRDDDLFVRRPDGDYVEIRGYNPITLRALKLGWVEAPPKVFVRYRGERNVGELLSNWLERSRTFAESRGFAGSFYGGGFMHLEVRRNGEHFKSTARPLVGMNKLEGMTDLEWSLESGDVLELGMYGGF